MKKGGLAVPDLKLYYKAVVIRTIISKTVYDKPKEHSFWDKNPLFDKKLQGKLESSMGETGSRSTSDTLYQDKFRMGEGVEYKEGNYK